MTQTAASENRLPDHRVGFYGSERELVRTAVGFLEPGLREGSVAIVIATPEHRTAFADELAARGTVPGRLGDRYVELDAAQTLDAIVLDGVPDRERFHATVGGVVAGQVRAGRRVLAYGEMVALLWDAGDAIGALRLEELWNELGTSTPHALLCAYPTTAFEDDLTVGPFRSVCDLHSGVIPSSPPVDDVRGDPLRRLAMLEQQTVVDANRRAARGHRAAGPDDPSADEQPGGRDPFTAMVLHDLRNPATVVAGTIELLRRHLDELDETDVRRSLADAARSADRIMRLLDDVLLASQLDSGRFTYELHPVDLARTVEEVAAQVRRVTARAIDVDLPPRLRPALADPTRQAQVLTNLLSNAVRYSPEPEPITLRVRDDGAMLRVEVHDRGDGIDADDIERLFEPFTRLPSARRAAPDGTGLGLTITRMLVEGQGGDLEVQSEPGAGSTFSYTVLPAAAAPAGASGGQG